MSSLQIRGRSGEAVAVEFEQRVAHRRRGDDGDFLAAREQRVEIGDGLFQPVLEAHEITGYRFWLESGLPKRSAYRVVNGDARNLNADTLDATIRALRDDSRVLVEKSRRKTIRAADDRLSRLARGRGE